MAAEFCDQRAVRALHRHVVDAAAAGAGALDAFGSQPVAQLRRTQERHRAVLRHGALIVTVAGEGEGGIGQREDVAAVAHAVPVGHGFA